MRRAVQPCVAEVMLTPVTPFRMDVSWRPLKGAAAYRVHRGHSLDFPVDDGSLVAIVTDPIYADRTLAPDTAYYFRVVPVVNGRLGRPSAAAEGRTKRKDLVLRHEGNRLTVSGDAFEVEWDLNRGGEIVALRQYDGNAWVTLLSEGDSIPGYVIDSAGRRYTLDGVTARADVRKVLPDEICFALTLCPRAGDGTAAGLEIRLVFHVFREGWIFCKTLLLVHRWWAPFPIERVAMHAALNRRLTRAKCAWLYFDRKTRSAFTWKRPADGVEDRVLYPYVAVDYGLNPELSFTNHVAFLLEDWRGFRSREETRTRFGKAPGGGLRFEWILHDGPPLVMKPGDSYRNTWGIGLGAARKGTCREFSAALGNNMSGRGYWHWHSGDRQGHPAGADPDDWPWHTHPRFWSQPASGSSAPTNDEIDRQADRGAKLLVHHQTWMRCGGSNTYPPADYIPRDPDDLRRMVAHAHARGLRVALYMRGVEPWALNMPYWEQFLTRDVDGLYVDWNSPLCYRNPGGLGEHQGCFKPWDEHFSAYDYFRYTRMLRKRVGEGGFLLGHANMAMTFLALAVFDGYLAGESLEQKQHLCDSLDAHVFYTMKNCCGGAVINYVGPYGKVRALSAATGTSFMNEQGPLWRMWASIPMDQARVFDSLTENLKVLRFNRPGLHGCVFRVSRDQCLITVANLGPATTGNMTLDMPALGLVGTYRVTRLTGRGDHPLASHEMAPTTGRIPIQRLARYAFCAYKLDRTNRTAKAKKKV